MLVVTAYVRQERVPPLICNLYYRTVVPRNAKAKTSLPPGPSLSIKQKVVLNIISKMSAAGGPPNSFYNPNKGTNPTTNFGAANSSSSSTSGSNMMYDRSNPTSQAAAASGYNRTSFSGSNAAMPPFPTAPPRSGNANTVHNPQQQSFRASTSSGNFNLAESGIYSSDAATTTSYSQQQQQQTVPNYWNPAVLATGNGGNSLSSIMMMNNNNDMILDLASSAGRTFIASGMARFVPGLERILTSLRYYFAVDNKFVQRKIITVLFPYAKKHWRRMVG